jgi:hypothetical protein
MLLPDQLFIDLIDTNLSQWILKAQKVDYDPGALE